MLENQVLRMKSPGAGAVRRAARPQASGREVVVGSASGSLFSIVFAKEDRKAQTIESAAAGESDVSVTKQGR